MFKLEMRTPVRDVLRLLAGRLDVDDARMRDWLDRGREPYLDLFRRSHDRPEELREHMFQTTDRTPETVRTAAYRVEARRSLLAAVGDVAAVLLAIGVVAGPTTVLVLGLSLGISAWWALFWGGVVALAFSALVGLVWRRARAGAIEAVPWRQGLEPLVWALYYPVQTAQEVFAAKEDLENAGDATIRSRFEALEAQIRRGPDDKALPNQDDELWAAGIFMMVTVPDLMLNSDASRWMAKLLCDRAPAAAELMRGELARQVGLRKTWRATGPGDVVAETVSARGYNYLMSASASFATLPRPSEMDVEAPMRTHAQDPAFQLLVSKSEDIFAAAKRAARGHWPTEASTTEWKRPKRHGWEVRVAGTVLIAAGLLVTLADIGSPEAGYALIVGGASLLPTTAAGVVKDVAALHAPRP